MADDPKPEYHESHVPDEPRDIGLGKGLAYCRACGTLLWSAIGPSGSRRSRQPCEPTRIDLR